MIVKLFEIGTINLKEIFLNVNKVLRFTKVSLDELHREGLELPEEINKNVQLTRLHYEMGGQVHSTIVIGSPGEIALKIDGGSRFSLAPPKLLKG